MSLHDDKCTHGNPLMECLDCLRTERDALSESCRRDMDRIRYLWHRIDRLKEILDEAHDLIICHHSDEQMKGDVCKVCTDPNNALLVSALEENRRELNKLRKEQGQPAPF